MEKNPTAAAAAHGAASAPPVGVCQRLFNALQIHPAFNNIRRLTYRQTGGAAAAAAQEQGSYPVPTPPPMATAPQARPPQPPLLQTVPPSPAPPSRPSAPVLVPVKSTLGVGPDNKVQGSVPRAPGKGKMAPAAGGKAPAARLDTSSVAKAASEATTPQATVEEPSGTGGQPQAGKPKRNINRTRKAPSHLWRTTTTAK